MFFSIVVAFYAVIVPYQLEVGRTEGLCSRWDMSVGCSEKARCAPLHLGYCHTQPMLTLDLGTAQAQSCSLEPTKVCFITK